MPITNSQIKKKWPIHDLLSQEELTRIINAHARSKLTSLTQPWLIQTVYEIRRDNDPQLTYEDFIASIAKSSTERHPRKAQQPIKQNSSDNKGTAHFSALNINESGGDVQYRDQEKNRPVPDNLRVLASSSRRTLYANKIEHRTKAHGQLVRVKKNPSEQELQPFVHLFQQRTSNFQFVVTMDKIDQRLGSKRPYSQKTAMSGYSAQDIFQFFGFVANKDGHEYHLAHQAAWCLGGAQLAINLNPGTAGSNYCTYALLESQAKYILSGDERINEVTVGGRVQYWSGTLVPKHVYYCLSWGENKQLEVRIDPCNYDYPHKNDHRAVREFIDAMDNADPHVPPTPPVTPWQFGNRRVFNDQATLCEQQGFFAHHRVKVDSNNNNENGYVCSATP